VLQDLNQLKRHYPDSYETFLGNAGCINAFGVVDRTTTQYLSDLLGQTVVLEEQPNFVSRLARDAGDPGERTTPRAVPLLAPDEITYHFARDKFRQLVIIPESKEKIFMRRFPLPARRKE
jgi:type IV secretion system protein VirD4